MCDECKTIEVFFFIFLFFKDFLMWTIFFKVFIEFNSIETTLFLLYILFFWPQGMRDLTCLTRDQTCPVYTGRRSPDHCTARGVPKEGFICSF